MNYTVIPAIDRQAAAVSEVKQMHDDLTDAQAVITMAAVSGTRARNRVIRMINLSSEKWFSGSTPIDPIWVGMGRII